MQETPFEDVTPQFGKNYDRGWIGFNHATSVMSQGIAFFTRFERTNDIVVSHAFIVTGEDECVEANYPSGVVCSRLQKDYFEREDRSITFRRPKQLSAELADRIVEKAKSQVGDGFDYSVLANHALQDNFVGWLINDMFDNKPKNFLDRMLEDSGQWICSELVAYCLKQQREYENVGVLANAPGAITPQMLFEDDELFEPFQEDQRKLWEEKGPG